MTYWFTSDTHFSHDAIRQWYPARAKFADFKEQREALVDNWNSVIKPNDTVYHIGDFDHRGEDPAALVNRLNGKKILVAGNHDRKYLNNNRKFYEAFHQVYKDSYAEVTVNGQFIVMCHFPIWEWYQIHRGAWHLHGHLHGKPHGIPGKIMDVGVDGNNLMPYSFEEVQAFMASKPVRKHHG